MKGERLKNYKKYNFTEIKLSTFVLIFERIFSRIKKKHFFIEY